MMENEIYELTDKQVNGHMDLSILTEVIRTMWTSLMGEYNVQTDGPRDECEMWSKSGYYLYNFTGY